MKIKLLEPQVINGSVWPRDSVVEVPTDQAKQWIAAHVAVQESPLRENVLPNDEKDRKEKKK